MFNISINYNLTTTFRSHGCYDFNLACIFVESFHSWAKAIPVCMHVCINIFLFFVFEIGELAEGM